MFDPFSLLIPNRGESLKNGVFSGKEKIMKGSASGKR